MSDHVVHQRIDGLRYYARSLDLPYRITGPPRLQ